MHLFSALCYCYILGIHLLFFDRSLKFKKHPKELNPSSSENPQKIL